MAERARILLVDDVPANLHTLSSALGDDYELSIATSGAGALDLAAASTPDLILLDVMMPDMDGIETLTRLRRSEWGRYIPVILVTADDRATTRTVGFELGAEDLIAKPVVVPMARARVRGVLERQRLRRELSRLTTFDELTGALNRRNFLDRCEAQHARLRGSNGSCGLVLVDLDRFASVNEHHGTAAGDAVLATVAEHLVALLGDADLLGRVAGDQFALLLVDSDPAATLSTAERARGAVTAVRVASAGGTEISVTSSLGVTAVVADDGNVDAALRRAGRALQAAKMAGGSRVCEVPTGGGDER